MAISGVNHLTVIVTDLDKSLAFYQLLGFEPLVRWQQGAYLQSQLAGAAQTPVWLALNLGQAQPGEDYSHLAFSVEPTQWSLLTQQLTAAGVLPARLWQDNRSEGASIYLLDPDGHRLELHLGSVHSRLQGLREQPYAQAQWLAASATAQKTALLIVDLQQALFPATTAGPHPLLEPVLTRVNQLIALAQQVQAPVIVVQHHVPNTPLQQGEAGWQCLAGLALPAHYQRIDKTTPDSFVGTPLQSLLQQLGVERLVVTGYASEFCIDTTVRSAASRGFVVDLVSDAHLTQDKAHADAKQIIAHVNATLPAIRSFAGAIRAVTAEQVCFD